MSHCKRYQLEEFHKLLPRLNFLLSGINLSRIPSKPSHHCVDGIEFMAYQIGSRFGFGLGSERPIFPTIEYELSEDGSVRLLQFRFDPQSIHSQYI